jgi:hypothetical protein
MALSSSPWYAPYAALGLTPEGLTPAEDQQLAGLIMWVPGGFWHLAASLWFLAKGLGGSADPGLHEGPADRDQNPERDEGAEPGRPAPAVF